MSNVPPNKTFELLHASYSYCTHNDSDNSQRSHSKKYVVSPAHRHANELLRDLLSKESEQRSEVAQYIDGEFLALEAFWRRRGDWAG